MGDKVNNSMREDQFLRKKNTVVYDEEKTIVDVATGEILNRESIRVTRSSTEPEYIKIYYKTMLSINDISDIPLEFLLALSAQIGYANSDTDAIYFYNNKTTRRIIAEYCKIGDNMVGKYIRRCVMKGILFTTKDRGTYEVNPWMIAKGKWEHIKELQANFTFLDGKWSRIITMCTDEKDDKKTEPEGEVPPCSA